jgi:hypothetical protein
MCKPASALIALLLALLLVVDAAESAEPLETDTKIACIEVKYSSEFLQRYPDAPAACLEAVEKDGKRYAKFNARVYLNSADRMTVELLNVKGDGLSTFSFKPRPDATVNIDGKMTKFADLRPGERITFWVSEDRLIASVLPPSTEESWAVLPPYQGPLRDRPPLMSSSGSDTKSFPWPPPTPTTQAPFDRELLVRDGKTLGDVADRLTKSLAGLGYSERSFYHAPGGFVLATRLEQIDFDGTPKTGQQRWSAKLPPREIFSLSGFIKALFSAPEGHYRVIVFVVNDQPFSTTGRTASQADALAWLQGGLNRLPPSIAKTPLNDAHDGTALIYQFRKVGQSGAVLANPDGAAPAVQHLERSGILDALGG